MLNVESSAQKDQCARNENTAITFALLVTKPDHRQLRPEIFSKSPSFMGVLSMEQHDQTNLTNDYPRTFLEQMHREPSCEWCKHPEQPLYRAGFCRHCYRINREVSKLESQIRECKRRKQSISHYLLFRLKTARKMVYLAKAEGSTYGNIHKKNVLGSNLELQFSQLSKALIKKDLYDGNAANLFDWSFSPDQKRLIYYLLSKLMRERSRRARRGRAMG